MTFTGILKKVFTSSIGKAYLSSILGIISGLLTQLIFIKTLIGIIPPKDFSLYSFIFQITSYLAIFQLGLDFATARDISINLGKSDLRMANYSYWFIKRYNLKMIFVALSIICLVSFLFYKDIGLESSYNSVMASVLLLLFGFSQMITFWLIPNVAALIGTNLQYIYNISNVVVSILSTLIGYVLLKLGYGVYSLPIALIFFNICNNVFLSYITKKNCNWISLPPVEKNRSAEKKTIRFSIAATLGGLAWTIEATCDVIILNALGLMHLVGIYVIWWRFPQMFFDLATRFTVSSIPTLNSVYGRSIDESKILFKKILLIVAGAGFLIFTGLMLWLPSFIDIWIEDKNYSYDNFRILSLLIGLVILLRIIGNCFGTYIITIGKVRVSSQLSWVQAVIKIFAAIPLVKLYNIEGLFLASIIASLIQVIGLGAYLLAKNFINKRIVIWAFFMLLTCLLFFFLYNDIETGIFSFLIKTLATCLSIIILWLASIWVFGLSHVLGIESALKKINRRL